TRLEWHVFEEDEKGSWVLHLIPPYYADLFVDQEPSLMQKALSPWEYSEGGKSKFTIFTALTLREIDRIRQFIVDYRQLVLLGLNKNIEAYFADELDACLALDYNYKSPALRSEIGEWEYQAKYNRSRKATRQLGEKMLTAMKRFPTTALGVDTCISYVPPNPDRSNDLPRNLAEFLVKRLKKTSQVRKKAPLVYAQLEISKPSSKRLPVSSRIKLWREIISSGAVRLSSSVAGTDVYVIDDLCQSGASMWSYARYLKSVGASRALGLVCVKTRRDTDNE
ncbi:MAG: hypothetical protein KAT58_12635, partial [candidate division Zixibacteria bacterium]|nr:hypothetical protein [candidate division Zixibacteria bacterium]